MEPLKYCPVLVRAFLPSTWQKIQDSTHLVLIIGVVCCGCLVLQTIISLLYMRCWSLMCIKEVLALIFIIPCTTYAVRIIGQYDDRLQSKQQHAKAEKENLTKAYNDLLTDMDEQLTKSAESSAGLAERSFESKRRDFQRFLERAKQRYSSLYSGTKADSDQLLKQFRRFCMNWLSVFKECSIDPIQCPRNVVTQEELMRCTNIAEVADLCLERLKITEVRFISIQRDEDAKMLRKNRNEFRRLTIGPDGTRMIVPAGNLATAQAQTVSQCPRQRGRVSWFSIGRGHGWRWDTFGRDGFPREIQFGCGRLVLLSREHAVLIVGFIVGWVIFGLEFLQHATAKPQTAEEQVSAVCTVIEVVITQCCLFVMLYRFEDIDTIQQLEREVKELTRQNEHVQQQRERMREFWSNAQQLTELWLHRTVPRLDLYKELHSQLEDAPQEELLLNITGANDQLEELERNLGALKAWRNDGSLNADDKKKFGNMINGICQEPDVEQILVRLDYTTTTGMKQILALPSSQAPSSSSVINGTPRT